MAAAIVSVVARQRGGLVAVRRDGTLSDRRVAENAISGDYSTKTWRPIALTGLDGARVVQVAVQYDDKLVALTSTGEVFEQYHHMGDPQADYRWRPVPTEG